MDNLPINIQNAINKFVEESKKILGKRIKKIILYGSYARGDYNNSSDIDILVSTDYKQTQFYAALKKLSSMTYDIELDYNVILVPLINNINNYNDEIDEIPFYMNIQKEASCNKWKMKIDNKIPPNI